MIDDTLLLCLDERLHIHLMAPGRNLVLEDGLGALLLFLLLFLPVDVPQHGGDLVVLVVVVVLGPGCPGSEDG